MVVVFFFLFWWGGKKKSNRKIRAARLWYRFQWTRAFLFVGKIISIIPYYSCLFKNENYQTPVQISLSRHSKGKKHETIVQIAAITKKLIGVRLYFWSKLHLTRQTRRVCLMLPVLWQLQVAVCWNMMT